MDWYITTIQAYLNIKAALAAVAITSFVRYWLPAPDSNPEGFWHQFAVRQGPIINRVVTFLPVVIAFVATYFFEADSRYTFEDGFRGVLSGAFAAYSYKGAKTAIFGN